MRIGAGVGPPGCDRFRNGAEAATAQFGANGSQGDTVSAIVQALAGRHDGISVECGHTQNVAVCIDIMQHFLMRGKGIYRALGIAKQGGGSYRSQE